MTRIIEIEPQNDLDRFLRVINLSDYFLAGYASPYIIVQKYLPKLFVEFALIYDDILNNRIDSPFKDFSSIQLLWFFQAIIKTHYGYKFFEKSVDDGFLTIDLDANLSKETKMNSLFFVSATASEIGIQNPYDYIVKNYKSDFPLLLGLGIKYEGSRLTTKTDILTKYINKISGQIKKSHTTNQYAKLLHKIPVKNSKLLE